ncbi:2-hydroxyacid dehydrogenase [Roseomonas gilardii]|uniref:2-hydroxyacid dehydrogenase n=1 Tax=Roseomonas gilardii TaxID=257708 RepID=UPI001431E55F|nr:2-hydroxyacid dehydrogenase [Roseomonas gilardii]
MLYLTRGEPELYAVARGYVPPGFELVTLETDSSAELAAALQNCEVIIVATRRLDAEMIAAAPHLQLVLHQGVGYHDTIDVPALQARGVPVATTPDGTATGVSEHAVMLMLAACRHLTFADAELRAGRFHVNALRLVSRTLAERTIGYVGMGRIGQATARRLCGWGTKGIYTDPSPLSGQVESELGLQRVEFEELLERADVVTLHLPLTASTRGLINVRAFAHMRRGTVLINTARGPIVDEDALLQALETKHLGAAALDVFEREPVGPAHPLARFSNVVLTPHIAAGTLDTYGAKMRGVFANVARFYSGQQLQDQVA